MLIEISQGMPQLFCPWPENISPPEVVSTHPQGIQLQCGTNSEGKPLAKQLAHPRIHACILAVFWYRSQVCGVPHRTSARTKCRVAYFQGDDSRHGQEEISNGCKVLAESQSGLLVRDQRWRGIGECGMGVAGRIGFLALANGGLSWHAF